LKQVIRVDLDHQNTPLFKLFVIKRIIFDKMSIKLVERLQYHQLIGLYVIKFLQIILFFLQIDRVAM